MLYASYLLLCLITLIGILREHLSPSIEGRVGYVDVLVDWIWAWTAES